jgi:hypothetical protein
VQITSIYDKIVGKGRPEISQNGLKYRTICSACNNNVGTWYDSHLVEISKIVTGFIETNLTLPDELTLNIYPIKIIKSVLAHILAARKNFYEGEFEDSLRESVINLNEKIPEHINIFYWVYPYQTVQLIRDVVLIDNFSDENFGQFSILKYYPLGFLMTNLSSYKELPSLSKYHCLSINDSVDIRIKIKNVPEADWPENCKAILMGKDGLDARIAVPKPHVK